MDASDRKKYPFILSTEDFKTAKSYHKVVLNSLKGISDNIIFLSAGYSYSDHFAKYLLKNIDSYDFRNQRWLFNIDPYVNDNQLDFFTDKKICVIKSTLKDFIESYYKWESGLNDTVLRSKEISIYDYDNKKVYLDPKIYLRLEKSLVQLNKLYKFAHIEKREFYLGNEPNYGVIIKNYDVVKTNKLEETRKEIINIIDSTSSKIIPLFFLIGNFGTGKTTFTYRLLNNLQMNHSCVVFEVLDYFSINENDIVELISNIKAEYVFFYFNYVERHSVFRALTELRGKLSTHQIPNIKISFIASIRENILNRIKVDRSLTNEYEINIDSSLSNEETSLLLDNLKECSLLNFSDKRSKLELVKKIQETYEADTFITLLDLISGKHYIDLLEAYRHLPSIAQTALIYTSLLHQYNILMPVGLLKSLVAKNWDIFRNELLEIDCKNILIQEESDLYNLGTDIFFRTKHPIIAKKLIEKIIPNKDQQYKNYEDICSRIEINPACSRVIIDLLKVLNSESIFNSEKINRLYDLCYNNLSEDPYFLLNYSINLQMRGDEKAISKALRLIQYAEGFFDYRHHKFIHRRAILNFLMAKIYFEKEKSELLQTYHYIKEAEELFEIKQILDSCSYYSFYDYIEFKIWLLSKINMKDDEQLRTKIKIEEMFELAERTVLEGLNKILVLKSRYIDLYHRSKNEDEYIIELKNYYQDEAFRPLALILLYNFYGSKNNQEECKKLLNELEYYSFNDEVSKFLFKIYGRNTNKADIRKKFFELERKHEEFSKENSLRYNYLMFVANCYSDCIDAGYNYLNNIKYMSLNPEYNMVWLDENDNEKIFEGIIIKNKKNVYRVKIIETQQKHLLEKGVTYSEGDRVSVKLKFFLYGIRASIVK